MDCWNIKVESYAETINCTFEGTNLTIRMPEFMASSDELSDKHSPKQLIEDCIRELNILQIEIDPIDFLNDLVIRVYFRENINKSEVRYASITLLSEFLNKANLMFEHMVIPIQHATITLDPIEDRNW